MVKELLVSDGHYYKHLSNVCKLIHTFEKLMF